MQLSDVTEGFTEKPFAEAAAVSAEVDAERIEFLRTETQILDVPMTDEQREEKLQELLATHAEADALTLDLADATAKYKAEKQRLTDEIDNRFAHAKHLRRMLRSGEISEDVECRVEKVFATGTIRTVRIDTGETIDERALEADERQADLFATIASDAPESFSDLHESEPPRAITVEGEVVDLGDDDTIDFDILLANFGTRVHVQRGPEASDSVAGGDHVELVGHYGGEGGEEIATFIASEIRVLDPETEIDASKMATVGDVVEHKANGKGRAKLTAGGAHQLHRKRGRK